MTQESMSNPADSRQEYIIRFHNTLVHAGEKDEVIAYMLRPENLAKLSNEQLTRLTEQYKEHGATAQNAEKMIKEFNQEVAAAKESILKAVEQKTSRVVDEILKKRQTEQLPPKDKE